MCSDYELEREHDLFYGVATPADSMREYAYNAGMDNPNQPWILTDYDVWVANPHYKGPPVDHPEYD